MRTIPGRTVWKTAAALSAAATVACAAWLLYRAIRMEHYRRDLTSRGFPAAYVAPLASLQFDHPRWRFEMLPVADMSWDEIVAREETPSWNLVIRSDWAPDEWRALKERNYTPYCAANAAAYDSGAWYQASREAIAYFMDPRNFLNERDIFMFETLGYDAASQKADAVERILAQTFMAHAPCDGGPRTFAEVVADAGRRFGVSPVFLAGRLASEQGVGTPQSFGTIGDALFAYATNATGRIGDAVVWGRRFMKDGEATKRALARGRGAYNGFYNFFNFRAYGLGLFEIKYNAWVEATSAETKAKYFGPWTSQARAIEGGSLKIREMYVDTHRHTRYLQKFSVLREAGVFRWKQYMQNIAAPLVEARNTAKAYRAAGTFESPYRFLLPVYRAMPERASPDPAGGRSVYSPSR